MFFVHLSTRLAENQCTYCKWLNLVDLSLTFQSEQSPLSTWCMNTCRNGDLGSKKSNSSSGTKIHQLRAAIKVCAVCCFLCSVCLFFHTEGWTVEGGVDSCREILGICSAFLVMKTGVTWCFFFLFSSATSSLAKPFADFTHQKSPDFSLFLFSPFLELCKY